MLNIIKQNLVLFTSTVAFVLAVMSVVVFPTNAMASPEHLSMGDARAFVEARYLGGAVIAINGDPGLLAVAPAPVGGAQGFVYPLAQNNIVCELDHLSIALAVVAQWSNNESYGLATREERLEQLPNIFYTLKMGPFIEGEPTIFEDVPLDQTALKNFIIDGFPNDLHAVGRTDYKILMRGEIEPGDYELEATIHVFGFPITFPRGLVTVESASDPACN